MKIEHVIATLNEVKGSNLRASKWSVYYPTLRQVYPAVRVSGRRLFLPSIKTQWVLSGA